jgi:hypothetical protein
VTTRGFKLKLKLENIMDINIIEQIIPKICISFFLKKQEALMPISETKPPAANSQICEVGR